MFSSEAFISTLSKLCNSERERNRERDGEREREERPSLVWVESLVYSQPDLFLPDPSTPIEILVN